MYVDLISAATSYLSILIVTCLIFLAWYLLRNTYDYWKKREIPYEEPTLLLGNLGFFMRKSIWEFFYELKNSQKTDYCGIYLALKPAFVVQTPELVKKVLVKNHEHFENRYIYAASSNPLGSLNLFTIKNPIWSDMRYKLSPLFTSARLRILTEIMNVNAEQLVKKIQRDYVDDNKSVNLKKLFSLYTSDTVAYTVFGLRVSALNDESKSPLWVITKHIVNYNFRRRFEFSAVFLIPALAKFMGLKFFSNQATDYIKSIFKDVVKDRKQKGSSTAYKDLVDQLLKIKDDLNEHTKGDTELAENLMMAQVAVFILGSVETSSTTLSYCFHELAHSPEKQEKLYNEINDSYKRTGKNILNYDDLMEMTYMSACIIETLRKYPPVPYIDRVCGRNYKFNDDITIEKGIPVFVNVMALHYNEDYYPKPHEWRPERHTITTDNENYGYTFLPFGEGPRFCIGKRLGMMQIRAAMAQVLHKYRLEPGPQPYEIHPDPYSIILGPNGGGCVKFIPR